MANGSLWDWTDGRNEADITDARTLASNSWIMGHVSSSITSFFHESVNLCTLLLHSLSNDLYLTKKKFIE